MIERTAHAMNAINVLDVFSIQLLYCYFSCYTVYSSAVLPSELLTIACKCLNDLSVHYIPHPHIYKFVFAVQY